jgi:hypothetical protein
MSSALRTPCLTIMVLCVVLSSCQVSPRPRQGDYSFFDEACLEALLTPVASWESADYSYDDWLRLASVAKIVQQSTPNSVEKALHRFQLGNSLHSDAKLLLLMRVAFDLPEFPGKNNPNIMYFWATPPASEIPSWPVHWINGFPSLVSGPPKFRQISPRYDAGKEYQYFRRRYPFRDLSQFPSVTALPIGNR